MNNELLKRIISSVIFLPIVYFLILQGSIYFIIFLIICLIISIYEWLKMTKNKKKYFYIGFLFLILSFFSTYLIRFNLNEGEIYLLLILLICIGTDLGGFLFGKIIKGPKLTKISPNKTYSGMIGSFFLPNLLCFLLSSINNLIYSFKFDIKTVFIILLISAVSQFGDLMISYFKRISNLKDTGIIIPGHGGLLDRIDGMIFALPFSYLIISIFKIDLF